MNLTRIEVAAANIKKYQAALGWLEKYGAQLDGRGDSADVTVFLNLASACEGAREAAKVLTAYAQLNLPEVVKQAIACCQNTIAMSKDAIREEVERADATQNPVLP